MLLSWRSNWPFSQNNKWMTEPCLLVRTYWIWLNYIHLYTYATSGICFLSVRTHIYIYIYTMYMYIHTHTLCVNVSTQLYAVCTVWNGGIHNMGCSSTSLTLSCLACDDYTRSFHSMFFGWNRQFMTIRFFVILCFSFFPINWIASSCIIWCISPARPRWPQQASLGLLVLDTNLLDFSGLEFADHKVRDDTLSPRRLRTVWRFTIMASSLQLWRQG